MSHFTQNWMSYLDDSKKLTELTIPGTHDTCTYTASGLAQCQTMNLENQFKSGIRFWDIRLKVKDGIMYAYHGAAYLDLTFDNILTSSAILLQQFPSECIVMCISHEKNQDNEELYEKLWPIIKDLDSWYKEDRIPSLSEVRGKIIFMRRFKAPHSNFSIGINAYNNWPENSTERWKSSADINFTVQDEFSTYSSLNLDKKFNTYVKPVLDEAKNNENRLFINFTSGTVDGGGSVFFPPRSLADVTNPLLFNYLNQNKQARFGIIPMDFPESEPRLIRKLIGCNFDPFHEIIFQKATVFTDETDGTWTMAKFGLDIFFGGHPDLVFIKTANTRSGSVEIKVALGPSFYQLLTFDKTTVFKNETDGTWLVTDYNRIFGIPNPFQRPLDLVFIKTSNTESKRVEIHIASGNSNYQKKIFQTGTAFKCENDGVWTMANYDRFSSHPDLVYIKTRNTASKKVEVHIASGASNYQTMILHAVTAFDCEQDGVWTMADWDGDGIPDLVFIKTGNTPSGHVEVHIASAKSEYKDRILECKTAFKCETDGTWLMHDFTGNHIPDLIFIKTANTPNNLVEVHVASGER